MEELPVGSEITLKVVEDKKGECNGCFFYEFASIYTQSAVLIIKRSSV